MLRILHNFKRQGSYYEKDFSYLHFRANFIEWLHFPKNRCFLLGAGLGAGATYYFLNGGKIDGIGKNSFQGTSQQSIADTSIPSELEWYYFNQDLQIDIRIESKTIANPFKLKIPLKYLDAAQD